MGAGLVLSGCTGSGSASVAPQSPEGTDATVIRVIDGDTFVASIDGVEQTVRLLNVDTPETKKPNTPVQCLGPEATEYLQERLPVGGSVQLEYDVERTDRFDRTLAGVFSNGDFVNADVAREGFGIAVLFEPNDRFYADVLRAQGEAAEQKSGLFSPIVECTIPSKVESAIDGLAALSTDTPATAEEASGLLAGAATALAAGESAELLLKIAGDSAHAVRSGIRAAVVGTLAPKLATALDEALIREASLEKQRQSLAAKEQKAAAQAKEEADAAMRAEAARKAAAEHQIAEEAARKRVAQDAARRQAAQKAATQSRQVRETARQLTERPSAPSTKKPFRQAPKKSTNPYPGYTGPRCYAPGGKTWKPCP